MIPKTQLHHENKFLLQFLSFAHYVRFLIKRLNKILARGVSLYPIFTSKKQKCFFNHVNENQTAFKTGLNQFCFYLDLDMRKKGRKYFGLWTKYARLVQASKFKGLRRFIEFYMKQCKLFSFEIQLFSFLVLICTRGMPQNGHSTQPLLLNQKHLYRSTDHI